MRRDYELCAKHADLGENRVTRQQRAGRISLAAWKSMAVALAFPAMVGVAQAKDAGTKCAGQKDAEKQIEAIFHTYLDGYRTRNPELLSSPTQYYQGDDTADHYVLFDAMPPFVDVGSKRASEKAAQYIDATVGPSEVTWTDKFIGADCSGKDGSYAYFRGILHAKFQYKDGRKFDTQLRHTLVFKKFKGKYLIVHEHASVPSAGIGMETPLGTNSTK